MTKKRNYIVVAKHKGEMQFLEEVKASDTWCAVYAFLEKISNYREHNSLNWRNRIEVWDNCSDSPKKPIAVYKLAKPKYEFKLVSPKGNK
jgi:hypothetical protein